MRRILTPLALAALCGTASAAEPPALSGRYTIDPYHTQPTVEWEHFGIERPRRDSPQSNHDPAGLRGEPEDRPEPIGPWRGAC
jgi:hypothetical protein